MAAAMEDMRRKAREASACGDFKLAEDLDQQAIEAGPATAELHINRAWVLGRSEGFDDSYDSEKFETAKEAFERGDFKLALDLWTEYIESSPVTPELYTGRALILIKLGRNIDAIEELNTALKLDPKMSKAYIMKGDVLMKMQDYHGAMAVFRLGYSYAPSNLTFSIFISKCEKQIDGSASGLGPSKPRYQHGFYNTKSEVVLSIYAKGISAQSLNVSIMAPDEEAYHFQCALFAKIIPEKSNYRVLAKEIEIRLAKKEDLTWLLLSKSSTINSASYEFSWAKKKLHHKNIVPVVQDQGNKGTCVFQSITSTARMEMKRLAALRDPPESSQIKFSTNDFVSEFRKAGETTPRLKNALKVFKERGVLIHGGRKYRIKGYQKIGRCFREIQRLLKLGRPIAGGFYADHTFQDLGPNDIYDYDRSKVLENKDETTGHAVVFVGFGWREARIYLVFLNSHGVSFGDEGFGRVYLDHVRDLHTIDV